VDIASVLRAHAATRPYFLGVFAANRLPLSRLPRPSIIIANTDNDSLPGSHWICMFLSRFSRGVDYFDSLGDLPYQPSFLRFIRLNGGLHTYTTRRIQSIYSDVCGEFCCTYALFRSEGYTLSEFLNVFKSASAANDSLIVEHFNASFTCVSHFHRPTLRAIHAQTCAPHCHVMRRACPAGGPYSALALHPTHGCE